MSPEIESAIRLLYGDLGPARADDAGGLSPESLKAAFRKRALELHPDRARLHGRSSEELSELFKDVKSAYEQLRKLLGRVPSPSWHESAAGRKVWPDPGDLKGDHYWEAGVPRIRLLLGQFLYYNGLVTFRSLVSAVTWQRMQRPAFGRIARNWNYLTGDEIDRLLASRIKGERLGDTAMRLGVLTPFQRNAVVGFQKWLQRPIGEFFREAGLLEEEEIVYLIGLLRNHNARVDRMKHLW